MADERLLLEARHLSAHYRGLAALHGVDLAIAPGEIVAVVGANGAGKSTLLRAIAGQVATAGEILFDGKPIARLAPHRISRLGVALVPEGRRLFPRLAVEDNLRLGAYARRGPERFRPLDLVFALFPRLRERLRQRAETLSGGEQQMLAIGRALMARPRLLLLDEPSLGLAPLIVRQIFQAIRTLNRETGLTVLLVEQNAYQALRLAHRGYVLVNGAITMAGTGAELLARPEIHAAYLEGGQ
jgi:branched-chain amino acid transport system ATP-binding protein